MVQKNPYTISLKAPACMFPLVLITLMGMGCYPLDNPQAYTIATGDFIYRLDSPDEKIELPKELEEISGLDYYEDDVLLCVQDEKGILYFFDTKEKKIIREIKFKKKGDYEGVTRSGDIVYIVQSDGDLYPVPLYEGNEVDIEKISTPFGGSNDIEGLCRGYKDGILYLACKGKPEVNNNGIVGRAVYAFNTKTGTLDGDPAIHLTSSGFRSWLKDKNLNPRGHMPFMPSGIEIHPVTGDIYLIASVGSLLLVMNRKGELVDMSPLKKRVLRQPEGICFDKSGNLYISSEGRGRKGYILKFNNRKITGSSDPPPAKQTLEEQGSAQ